MNTNINLNQVNTSLTWTQLRNQFDLTSPIEGLTHVDMN